MTRDHEIWHCYQRHVIYERHDRPFDPAFDHADIAMCNPLDEDHNEPDESWVHYSHWENRTTGWQWQMAGHMHGGTAAGHLSHGLGHRVSASIAGIVGGHTHEPQHAAPDAETKQPDAKTGLASATKGRARNTRRAATNHDLRALSKSVPLANPLAKFLDGLWSASAAGPPLEEKAVNLIHCSAVSLRTTTDLVNGRVILLAKDTEGRLCLLRPVLEECGKCVAAKFTCEHLPFGEVEGFDPRHEG